MKKNIFFVHGFGVRKDARGMFPDIESYLGETFSDLEFRYTDLNNFSSDGKDTFLLALKCQLENLQITLNQHFHKGGENILIAHSQGCVVASLLSGYQFQKIIFLSPPTNSDFDALLENMKRREGAQIRIDGESIFPRSDGSRTYIPKEYWQERKELNYIELYKAFFQKQNTICIIQAQDDELIDNSILQGENLDIPLIQISGNHNFEGTSRKDLLDTIKSIFREL